jgi:hypothetical protein
MSRSTEQEDRFEKALNSPIPVDSLRALALELSTEGYRKPQIIELFEQRLTLLQADPTREADADALRDVLDFLVGWCSPHMKLLREEDNVPPAPPC